MRKVLKSLLKYYRKKESEGTDREYLVYLEKGIANVLSSHFKIYLSFPLLCENVPQTAQNGWENS